MKRVGGSGGARALLLAGGGLLALALSVLLLLVPHADAAQEGKATLDLGEPVSALLGADRKVQPVFGDEEKALTVNTSARGAGLDTRVNCLASAATALPGTPLTGRRFLWGANYGANVIWISFDENMEAGAGRKVAVGDEFAYDLGPGVKLYCRAETADQTTLAGNTHLQEVR